MHDLLSAIVAGATATVRSRRRALSLERLAALAETRAPRGSLLRANLTRAGAPNIIAECKRRSPARGVLAPHYDPAAIARRYAAGGAAAISVLTEPSFFDGALAHLAAVRQAVEVPILRKDFIVDEYQLHEARCAGADAVLLIVAALPRQRLAGLIRRASQLGLAALVEVHTREELGAALSEGADLIGVNSRDLKTLTVGTAVFDELIGEMPPACVAVAESGIRSAEDVGRLHRSGYRGFLVGEWLMTHPDPEGCLRALTAEAAP